MKHGPVPSHTLDLMNAVLAGVLLSREAARLQAVVQIDRRPVNPHFSAVAPLDDGFLSESDIEALDATLGRYGHMPFKELRRLTHEDEAYTKAWEARGSRGSMPMAFEDFFDEEDPDAMRGIFEEMLENAELRRAFSSAG